MTSPHERSQLTWRMASLWTAIVFVVSSILGAWLLGQRIFLAPPWAAYSADLYWLIALLPPLVAFIVFALRRPQGNTVILAPLLGFTVIGFFMYLAIIGPGLYTDIHCEAQPSRAQGLLTCACFEETEHGSGSFECLAVRLPGLPFIRIVREQGIIPVSIPNPGPPLIRDFIN